MFESLPASRAGGAVLLLPPDGPTHADEQEAPQRPDAPRLTEASMLADAFSDFIAASSRLESSYRDLQVEVAQLSSELAARNAELESSLERNEQMHRALVEVMDSMPCGVLALGADAEVLRMNAEARRLFAFALDEEEPRHLAALSERVSVDLAALCSADSTHEFTVDVSPDDDTPRATRWLALRTRRLREGAHSARTILILSDISAHKQAEHDREEGRRSFALAEVAATLAHEIRNPLASLELFVDLLSTEPARTRDWLSHLRAGLRSLSSTVNNVLSFHGAGFLPLRPLLCAETVEAAVAFARPIAEQAGIALTFRSEDTTSRVMANDAALQQVILNLVLNAVRHTPASGTIAVSLERANAGRLRLAVADSGAGIRLEHLPHVFEAGWSANGAGNGLGLAVCQGIAEQHGTTLCVRSVAGQGTTFAMELLTL